MAKRPGESLPPPWPDLYPWWRLCASPVYLFFQNIYNWNALGVIMGISWSKSCHFVPVYQVTCLSRVGYWRDNMDIDSSSLSHNICYSGRKSLWNPTITCRAARYVITSTLVDRWDLCDSIKFQIQAYWPHCYPDSHPRHNVLAASCCISSFCPRGNWHRLR